jgi:hypothetical protein
MFIIFPKVTQFLNVGLKDTIFCKKKRLKVN